jgi:preprotein translocase subunit YajC
VNQNTLLVVYLVVMFGAMWFLWIGPQRKQRKQTAEMLAALKPGDKVITAGGVYGTVRSIDEDTVDLEVADGVVVALAKAAVVARRADGQSGDE